MGRECIIFDLDGTLTDFNKFLQDNAKKYFLKKYNKTPQDETKLELEDIYGLDLTNDNDKRMVNSFWISPYFIKFSLLGRFRKNARNIVSMFMKKGYKVEIHSSRAHTTEKNVVGYIAKFFTIFQIWVNGVFIPISCIYFYKNDELKKANIFDRKPLLVFDDKEDVVKFFEMNQIRTVCVSGVHNSDVIDSKYVKKIDNFETESISTALTHLLKKRDINCIENELNSRKFFNRIKFVGNVIIQIYHPVVLHEEHIKNDFSEGILYAPNHRSTLDPLIIESILKRNIHWAALLRFFKGEDSIFNNSKNSFLCNLTKYIFEGLHFFPIDRKSDNANANNYESVREMNDFLRNKYLVGIFPEGTTRKKPGEEFGTFDPSFITLAKKNDSWIQPITTLWIKEKGVKNKVVVNFGKPFKVGNMDNTTAYELYLKEQNLCLAENKKYVSDYNYYYQSDV